MRRWLPAFYASCTEYVNEFAFEKSALITEVMKGIADYGCVVNTDKTRANFPYHLNKTTISRLENLCHAQSFAGFNLEMTCAE